MPAADRSRKSVFVPALVDGAQLQFRAYTQRSGRGYDNWYIRCPHHDDCGKTRGCFPAATRQWGDIEPVAYLHAWLAVSDPSGRATHSTLRPTPAQVTAYAQAHSAELTELVRQMRVQVPPPSAGAA